jgi:hypothetical protein
MRAFEPCPNCGRIYEPLEPQAAALRPAWLGSPWIVLPALLAWLGLKVWQIHNLRLTWFDVPVAMAVILAVFFIRLIARDVITFK